MGCSQIEPIETINLSLVNSKYKLIKDLTPLSSFQNLSELYIADNQIVDITPLSSFKRIETLELSNNNISDLSPLANMKKLGEHPIFVIRQFKTRNLLRE